MLGLFYFWPRTTYPPDFIEPHPVLAVPDSSAGQLLQVTRFIAQTPRPEDPFAYPIPLGAVGPDPALFWEFAIPFLLWLFSTRDRTTLTFIIN
ncbi:hypothetical protein [Alishewanella longhuensis]